MQVERRQQAGVPGSSPGRRTGCSPSRITQHRHRTDRAQPADTQTHRHSTPQSVKASASTPSAQTQTHTEQPNKQARGGEEAAAVQVERRQQAGVHGSSPGRRTACSPSRITQHRHRTDRPKPADTQAHTPQSVKASAPTPSAHRHTHTHTEQTNKQARGEEDARRRRRWRLSAGSKLVSTVRVPDDAPPAPHPASHSTGTAPIEHSPQTHRHSTPQSVKASAATSSAQRHTGTHRATKQTSARRRGGGSGGGGGGGGGAQAASWCPRFESRTTHSLLPIPHHTAPPPHRSSTARRHTGTAHHRASRPQHQRHQRRHRHTEQTNKQARGEEAAAVEVERRQQAGVHGSSPGRRTACSPSRITQHRHRTDRAQPADTRAQHTTERQGLSTNAISAHTHTHTHTQQTKKDACHGGGSGGAQAASWCPRFESRTTHRLLPIPHHTTPAPHRSSTARRHTGTHTTERQGLGTNAISAQTHRYTHTQQTNKQTKKAAARWPGGGGGGGGGGVQAASWCPRFESRTTHRLLPIPHHTAPAPHRSSTARRHTGTHTTERQGLS
eukprot:SAG31_NODE_7120_length_1783_cov_20.478622_1_plen_555_part_10